MLERMIVGTQLKRAWRRSEKDIKGELLSDDEIEDLSGDVDHLLDLGL